MKDYDREFAHEVGKRLGQMSQQEAESWMPKPAQDEQAAVELPPLALDESVATHKKRRAVARAFYYGFIDVAENNSAAIDAIAELIDYGGDLDKIIQMMALNLE